MKHFRQFNLPQKLDSTHATTYNPLANPSNVGERSIIVTDKLAEITPIKENRTQFFFNSMNHHIPMMYQARMVTYSAYGGERSPDKSAITARPPSNALQMHSRRHSQHVGRSPHSSSPDRRGSLLSKRSSFAKNSPGRFRLDQHHMDKHTLQNAIIKDI